MCVWSMFTQKLSSPQNGRRTVEVLPRLQSPSHGHDMCVLRCRLVAADIVLFDVLLVQPTTRTGFHDVSYGGVGCGGGPCGLCVTTR